MKKWLRDCFIRRKQDEVLKLRKLNEVLDVRNLKKEIVYLKIIIESYIYCIINL
jgi:hypothetical protein